MPCQRHHPPCSSGWKHRELPGPYSIPGQCEGWAGGGLAGLKDWPAGSSPVLPWLPVLRICGKQPPLRVRPRGFEAL